MNVKQMNTYATEHAAPETTLDGLHRVDGIVMALVYAKPWMKPAKSSARNRFLIRLEEFFSADYADCADFFVRANLV